MFNFFENCALENEEKLSEERAENIKTEVLSRIKEEKTMKHPAFKTFSLAAIIAAALAVSAMAAGAEKPSSAQVKQAPTTSETVTSETPESKLTNETPETKPTDKTPESNAAPFPTAPPARVRVCPQFAKGEFAPHSRRSFAACGKTRANPRRFRVPLPDVRSTEGGGEETPRLAATFPRNDRAEPPQERRSARSRRDPRAPLSSRTPPCGHPADQASAPTDRD